MTTLRKDTKTKLDTMYLAGANPEKMKTTDAIGIKSYRRWIQLVDNSGKKTPAGRYWEQISEESLPEGGFLQQTAVRDGNVETIKLRDGRRGVTRRWDPGSGEFKFTALGKRYYATLRRNYVVDVPIVIKGKRKNKSTYQIRSHVKMEKLGLRPVEVPLNLTLDQRREFVKRSIESELKKTATPIFEISDEQWWFDDTGSWGIHEETVGVDPESGVPEAHTILDRRVGTLLTHNNLLFPDAICDEANVMRDDKSCAPRQMAAILHQDLGEVMRKLSEVSLALYGTSSWEDQGATPRMIMEFCKQFNARTQDKAGKVLPVVITVYGDKSFDFIIKTPPAAVQLMEAAKLKKGSSEPNRSKVAKVTWDQVRAIAEDKMPDLNCFSIESAMKMVAGTARSMGINVTGPRPF